MAKNVYVTEFFRYGVSQGKLLQVPDSGTMGKTHVLDHSATSTASTAFAGNFVRIQADNACHVKFGSAPVATTSDMKLAADTPEYFSVKPGNKVSVQTG